MRRKIDEVSFCEAMASKDTIKELVIDSKKYANEEELYKCDGGNNPQSKIFKDDVQDVFNDFYDYYLEQVELYYTDEDN